MAEGSCSEKHSVDVHRPALNQRVETMASVIELLLDTLADFSDEELKRFKKIWCKIQRHKLFLNLSLTPPDTLDMQDTVFFLVLNYGQQSVGKTKEVLKKMKRTDLVQRLSGSSSGTKQKQSVDEHLSALIHKVATMASVKELLVETLKDLSNEDLKRFKLLLQFTLFQRSLPNISQERLLMTHTADKLVDLMVEECSQQSVEVIREVLMDMNRTDLVQRLSETSSGSKEKQSVDEHWPALIQEVETMASVIVLLLDTLADLSHAELKKFKRELKKFKRELQDQTYFDRCFSDISWLLLETKDMQDSVFFLVLNYGQQSVEKTKEVLKKMKRTDLVQRLSDRSSGAKKKQSADEHRSALIHKVATKAAVKHLVLETLMDLSNEEFEQFEFLQVTVRKEDLSDTFGMFRNSMFRHTDRSDTVDLMMQTYGQQSVEVTREVLEKINSTDLVQRLSKFSSEKHRPALLERVPEMEAVERALSETLNDLSYEEREKFKWLLHLTYFQKSLPQIPWSRLERTNRTDELVDLMVKSHGQQSVEVTREVFTDMNRTDLVERLSESSSRLKEKHPSELFQKDVTMTSPQEKILETLKDLRYRELEEFKWLLQQTEMRKGLPTIPVHRMEMADRVEMVELMVEIYGQQSEEMTREVLKTMNRNDLVQRLSDISSGSKGPSRLLQLESCGSITQDSSDWTKLEPEFSTDADESPTYSLQSEAGKFECTVSRLRWFCEEKVSFKYQFGSWEEHVERMESLKYMPAGPLVDITAIDGKLFEVYLPHWICIDDIPEILDKFAVLHMEDCGDVVEKVSEVTPSHVKLSEPTFSPRGVLMKVGIPVKINCNVLIYKTNTSFLTLHVYLIPSDPALQQAMDKRESSYGYKVIRKPHPEKSLKMRDRFVLAADLDGAEISPEQLKLRYESRNPNFFEVFIENPDRHFKLKLTQKDELQPVWTCAIRKDEYQSTAQRQGEHFVDTHRCDLIDRVSNIKPILDNLLKKDVIQQEDYDTIKALQTTQEMMRKLYSGPLKAAGQAGKDIFYEILEEKESHLVTDLKRKAS